MKVVDHTFINSLHINVSFEVVKIHLPRTQLCNQSLVILVKLIALILDYVILDLELLQQ